MSRISKERPKPKGVPENSRPTRIRSTNDEVQRAIEGLKDIPDNELQEFLDDEEFMQGLNVVDAWDGEEDLGEELSTSRDGRERDFRRNSRDRNRRDHRATLQNSVRDRLKREERRRDEIRRDPSKSSKDIERDKIRTKRDNESKILAEKEKAIKHLLDSDTVVPPGTEVEAIETEKQNMDRAEERFHRSRERRRSLDRHKITSVRNRRSGERITRVSPVHQQSSRSPFIISPDRRRSAERQYRKTNWERRSSMERTSWRERRVSAERHRRRMEEREQRIVRRSRSRERHRSRSQDRSRRRWSRSPVSRRSPRRRSESKSPDRRRKRSPFINEITRTFGDEALKANTGFTHQQQRPPLLPGPMMPQPHYMPHPEPLGPPVIQGLPGFNPYEAHGPPGPSMNFEPMPMHPVQPDYSAGPVLYNQPNNLPIHPPVRGTFVPLPTASPQPVPAPTIEHNMMFNSQPAAINFQATASSQTDVGNRGYDHTSTGYNGGHSHRDRLKTPEPPVISEPKQFEKTSLSSLLEASVSAKDSGHPVLYPGFKPEILRHCELALRDLPDEDPRLKIKGRFFFDPAKDQPTTESTVIKSNSILLQKNKCKPLWNELPTKKVEEPPKPRMEMHQKYCQTEPPIIEDVSCQTNIQTADFCVQVCPGELDPPPREEKRPIMDRLDWNVRETFDYPPKVREVEDLRWSLSNSSQKRPWHRNLSPDMSHEHEDDLHLRSPDRHELQIEHDSRDFHRNSPNRSRDSFNIHRGRNSFSPRDRYSPYRRGPDDYHENRSERSREDSPLVIDDHDDDDDDLEIIDHDAFSREPSWRGRGKSYGIGHKSRVPRGKFSSGRPFRGRGGGYRGKF